MASHNYSTHGFSLLQELGSHETQSRSYQVNPGGQKHENTYNLKLQQHLEPWKPFCSLSKSNHFVESESNMKKPRLLLDVNETVQEEVTEFVLSKTEELKGRVFDMSLLHDSIPISSVLCLNQDSVSIDSYAQIVFSSSRAEFYMSKNSARWRKLSRLVPRFQRFDTEVDAVNLDPVTPVPVKRVKPSPKKRNPEIREKEKDLRRRNHLHAFEILFSLMLGSEQHRQTTMLSLKKSCGDLSELLTRLSIGFAGIGIAVFFSVSCHVASGPVSFCANEVFETALSFSLVLLSWSVNRLREAIVDVNRKTIKDEEIQHRVNSRMKDVYLRAATALAMFVLRFR
ncbi:unnamed protein product [Cochlearia groenlandica]